MNTQDITIDIDVKKNVEIIVTKNGTILEVPTDISWDKYYNTIQDVLCLLKEKGLTIKQAQEICIGSMLLFISIVY